MKPSGQYAFRYYCCQAPDEVIADSSKMTQCCPAASRACPRTPFFWPIVSKRFWAETIDVFYASATFKVGTSIDLYILASSQQQCVRRMRYLVVRLGFGIKHHNRIWSPGRCSSVIKNFESLQGLILLIGRPVEDDENYSGTILTSNGDSNGKPRGTVFRGSRLEGSSWDEQRNWFPVFLRAFQQHRLQPELTRVYLFERNKKSQSKGPQYHHNDRRWKEDPDVFTKRREKDEAVQETRRDELAASLRAVLLGQDLGLLFSDREAEDERLLQEHGLE
ncbi:hypothetical protein E8E11_002396 [Didymella keratinophila]|nr:hypothetical protein E8E11_002396 [Didymella keratinophila]